MSTALDGAPDGANGALDLNGLAIMRKVADWQLQQPGTNAIDWIHAAMWSGIFALTAWQGMDGLGDRTSLIR